VKLCRRFRGGLDQWPNLDRAGARGRDARGNRGRFVEIPGFDQKVPATPIQDTQDERDAIKTVREFRTQANGESLRIWRG